MDYKARHEEFVSGLTGSSIADVYQVSAVVTAGYLSWVLLTNRLPVDHWITARLIDFFLNWVGPLLAITIYSDKPWQLVGLFAGPPILQRLIASQHKDTTPVKAGSAQKKPKSKPGKNSTKQLGNKTTQDPTQDLDTRGQQPKILGQIPYIGAYRATMLIMTMTAILAVDFRIFPRKYAKVETWGTSMMDLGVGSFVFSNGITSARPLLKKGIYGSPTAGMAQVVRLSGKMLLLGTIRLVAVKLLNYQEHVSEYGVHWNFFITLGVLPIFLPLFQYIGQYIPMVVLGLVVAIGYEIVLKNTGLLEWVLTADRTSIISQNKEGLSSAIGFIAIFLIGQSLGYFLLANAPTRSVLYPPKSSKDVGKPNADPRKNIKTLVVFGLIFEVLFWIFKTEIMVSRRLANLPYILWVCSYNTFLVAAFAIISLVAKQAVSESMSAVNGHGQTMFLISNLATGLVNMSTKTIDASPTKAIGVLVGYLGVLYTTSLALARGSQSVSG